jgi:hypothetical protein
MSLKLVFSASPLKYLEDWLRSLAEYLEDSKELGDEDKKMVRLIKLRNLTKSSGSPMH